MKLLPLFLPVLFSITACQQGMQATAGSGNADKTGNGSTTVSVRTINFSHCPSNVQAGLQLIQNIDDWQRLSRSSEIIGRHSVNPATQESTINFDTHFGVLVKAGSQPTPGYTLQLASSEATINAGTIAINLSMISPPSDAVMAQVLSYPCTIVELPKTEFNRIQLDISGDRKESLSLAIP